MRSEVPRNAFFFYSLIEIHPSTNKPSLIKAQVYLYFGGFLLRNKTLLPAVTEPQKQKKKSEVARLETVEAQAWCQPWARPSPGPGQQDIPSGKVSERLRSLNEIDALTLFMSFSFTVGESQASSPSFSAARIITPSGEIARIQTLDQP